jgi:hypothetical protein
MPDSQSFGIGLHQEMTARPRFETGRDNFFLGEDVHIETNRREEEKKKKTPVRAGNSGFPFT